MTLPEYTCPSCHDSHGGHLPPGDDGTSERLCDTCAPPVGDYRSHQAFFACRDGVCESDGESRTYCLLHDPERADVAIEVYERAAYLNALHANGPGIPS